MARALDCTAFLQWALPRLHLRWRGFRNVRRQVCKRLARRCGELQLGGLDAYRAFLEAHPPEWAHLAHLCRVTITRFGRDRAVWRRLVEHELPRLAALASAAGRTTLAAWSAGCAGGEEPYTLSMAWTFAVAPGSPPLRLDVLATDIDDEELARARAAVYPDGALKELDPSWRARAFEQRDGLFHLRDELRAPVRFVRHDLRTDAFPDGPFELVLCRNLAFTYFDEEQQRATAAAVCARLRPGGLLVVGAHERVPEGIPGLRRERELFYLRE